MRGSTAGLGTRLRRMRNRRRTGKASALLVPVPEAEFLHHRAPDDGARLGVTGLPMHVTVLYPFLETSEIDIKVQRQLQALAAARSPFEFSLSGIGRFPGVLYLATTPEEEFVELTLAVQARWPSHPLYGGAYEEITPHLTLALDDEPPGLAAAVEPALPIRAVARELLLMVNEPDGHWVAHMQFRLGG
jgi:2'-5' RNA ligase